jgi:hypothetical protein
MMEKMEQNRKELAQYLSDKRSTCTFYTTIYKNDIHKDVHSFYSDADEPEMSVISGSYLLYLMNKVDEYNDIDIFRYTGLESDENMHTIRMCNSKIQTIEYNNIILPSSDTQKHFGKFVALTHDLDCVRFFGIYNYVYNSIDIYGTKMGIMSLMKKTNYISLYAAKIQSVMERAKKYKNRGFDYKLEEDR